jgi:hypothetical protein
VCISQFAALGADRVFRGRNKRRSARGAATLVVHRREVLQATSATAQGTSARVKSDIGSSLLASASATLMGPTDARSPRAGVRREKTTSSGQARPNVGESCPPGSRSLLSRNGSSWASRLLFVLFIIALSSRRKLSITALFRSGLAACSRALISAKLPPRAGVRQIVSRQHGTSSSQETRRPDLPDPVGR